ncbi:hypothetical protein [Amycolatopsis sp. lyj-109]|uniref:hypothetical protein n=1 Tax=Amycolatopsis sp. lyj-109 TaxID=2789287 RepID=UPI003979D6FA
MVFVVGLPTVAFRAPSEVVVTAELPVAAANSATWPAERRRAQLPAGSRLRTQAKVTTSTASAGRRLVTTARSGWASTGPHRYLVVGVPFPLPGFPAALFAPGKVRGRRSGVRACGGGQPGGRHGDGGDRAGPGGGRGGGPLPAGVGPLGVWGVPAHVTVLTRSSRPTGSPRRWWAT